MRIGQIGERGAEVRLLEHERHGNADHREDFADVGPGEFPAGESPEEAGDGDDQDQLDPLGGLEVMPPSKLDPAPAAEDFGAEERDGDERENADAVGPVNDVDEAVVVDQRDEEHQDDADGEEADLLVIEAVELGVEGGGLDLEDRDEREQEDEAEKNPVEVAIGGEALHGFVALLFGCRGCGLRGGRRCRVRSAGLGVSAMRRLLSRLRCLVTKALMTCAATGAEASAPQPPCSHSTATTMSGLRRGAMPTNQALARSVPLPRLVAPALWLTTWAVPVLPAKSMPSRCDGGGGAGGGGCGHGVGDGLPVVGRDAGWADRRSRGSWYGWSRRTAWGTSSGKTTCGRMRAPPEAMPPSARASCKGVTVTAPWPMPTEITSPAYHFSCWVFSFHAVEGMVPETSSGRSMPVFWRDADLGGVLGDGVDAEPFGERVVEGVAGPGDGVIDVDHAVMLVAGEEVTVEGAAAVAHDVHVLGDVLFEAGERHDDLERRAGRELRLDGLVQQRDGSGC